MGKWQAVSRHNYEFASALPQYLFCLLGLLVGLPLTAGGVAILVYGTGGPNTTSAYIFGTLLLLFGGLLSALMVLTWPRRLVRWVRVYEEGLRWKAGGREYKYRWDEVTNVNRADMEFVGADGRRSDLLRTAYVVLQFADDTRVSFSPSLSDYGKLARYVQQAVSTRQLAEAAVELDETGKTFGPVHVSRTGVTAHGQFFTWKEVRWLAVHNGELCAHHACTAWRPIPLHEIPNYLLLLSLAKGLGRFRE